MKLGRPILHGPCVELAVTCTAREVGAPQPANNPQTDLACRCAGAAASRSLHGDSYAGTGSPDGTSDAQLQRAVRRGELHRIAAGIYMRADHFRELDARARHRCAVMVATESCGPGAIVSHASAAVMHGLDCGGLRLDTVHMTRNRCSGGRKSQTLHLHPAVVPAEEVVLIDGVATTSLARTFVDLARTTPFETAVVIGDCACDVG